MHHNHRKSKDKLCSVPRRSDDLTGMQVEWNRSTSIVMMVGRGSWAYLHEQGTSAELVVDEIKTRRPLSRMESCHITNASTSYGPLNKWRKALNRCRDCAVVARTFLHPTLSQELLHYEQRSLLRIWWHERHFADQCSRLGSFSAVLTAHATASLLELLPSV